MRAARLFVVLVLAAALLAASFPADHSAARVPPFKKVAVLFLENRGYNEIIGSGRAPYLNRLADHGALATRYYAVAHPSLPNDLALTTGSTQGIRSARFSWIAPDLMHDTHNASIRASDRYVSRLVPRIVRALGPDGVLFVTWDEAQGLTGPAAAAWP